LFRRSRDHIGLCVHEKWDEEKHEAEDYWNSPIFGERARNQMRWHVLRVSLQRRLGYSASANSGQGEKIRPSTKKIITCCVGIDKVEHENKAIIVYQDLYASSKEEPPERLEEDSKEVPVESCRIR